MPRSDDLRYDAYRGSTDPWLRIVTPRGAGVPPHFAGMDWKLMPTGAEAAIEFPAEAIESQGFFIFKLV